jgi:hypothetical protein
MTLRILAISVLVALPQLVVAQNLTLEQIMADPDWLGNPPENAYWGADNRTIFFEQKRRGSKLKNLISVDSNDGAIAEIAESDWSDTFQASIVLSPVGNGRAWVYSGDIYMSNDHGTHQVTRTATIESSPMFMSDGLRVAFERDGQMFVFNPATGLSGQITNLQFEKDPADEGEFDVLKAHQEPLYEQLRNARKDKQGTLESALRSGRCFERNACLHGRQSHIAGTFPVTQRPMVNRCNAQERFRYGQKRQHAELRNDKWLHGN